MTPLPHHYSARLSGGPTGYAHLAAAGLADLRAAPPVEFGGPGDAWTPEHLFLAAIEGCYLFTLRAIARAARIEFVSLDLIVDGTVDRDNGAVKFTDIVLRPQLVVSDEIPLERVTRLLERVDHACLISSSLSTPVRVEPEVIHQANVA